MHVTQKTGRGGFTLVEVMMAAILAVIFFASIFEINAMCLRSIGSAKESLAAIQSVQDRTERLRNLAFEKDHFYPFTPEITSLKSILSSYPFINFLR